MQKIAAPRGTADVYPPESGRWLALEMRIHALARRFGYGEIRTPAFEATELFVRGVGETTDIVGKEMYTFLDKGGRSMTLRPEWTAPVVRAVLEHNLLATGPQRLYYVGSFFRYEKPQKGRLRQAHQFGVECLGFAGAEADAEVIQLAYELLRSFGIADVTLKINSIGDASDRPAYLEALRAHFTPLRNELSEDSQRRLERNPLRILDSKAREDQAAIAAAPTLAAHLSPENRAHFERLCALLDAIGISYRIEPRLVRGFDYYTRTVFEFSAASLGAQDAVCGGGRYDELVHALGGPATPAVGFGLGLERFLIALEAAGLAPDAGAGGLALIALGDAARERGFPLVAALRRAGLAVFADYRDARIGVQFTRAERAGARAAVILGDDEIAAGTVVVRDLHSRKQVTLGPFDAPEAAVDAIAAWYASPAGDASAA
ncbi:MAG: histidine--tRNA ligase [Candidatus Eremiobacteraeota bacterium]|nr:histidine--tRNA ligase [Candidatus Eremiobacteraeota bacterium]